MSIHVNTYNTGLKFLLLPVDFANSSNFSFDSLDILSEICSETIKTPVIQCITL